MPISGKLYTAQELCTLLGDQSRQGVYNLARRHEWTGPAPGLYWAESVEPYLLHHRNIDVAKLPIVSADFPEGATWSERYGPMSSQVSILTALTVAGYKPGNITNHTYVYPVISGGTKAMEKSDRYGRPVDQAEESGAYVTAFMWADESTLAVIGNASDAEAEAHNLKAANAALKKYQEKVL